MFMPMTYETELAGHPLPSEVGRRSVIAHRAGHGGRDSRPVRNACSVTSPAGTIGLAASAPISHNQLHGNLDVHNEQRGQHISGFPESEAKVIR